MNPSQRPSPVRCLFLIAASALALTASGAHGALLAGWDFQGTTDPGGPIGTVIAQPPNMPRDFTANAGVFQSFSHLYLDGTNGSSSFYASTNVGNGDTEIGALNGISANTAGTNFNTTNSVGSLAFFNRTAQGGIDGKSAVFKLSMDGYQDLTFSFAVQRPPDNTPPINEDFGVSLFTFLYSIDGTNFEPWGSIDTGFGTAVTNQAFSLTPVLQAVNDADTIFIKMTISGSTGGINSTRVDSIQFNATAIPEPASIAILLSGLGILGARRQRVRIA